MKKLISCVCSIFILTIILVGCSDTNKNNSISTADNQSKETSSASFSTEHIWGDIPWNSFGYLPEEFSSQQVILIQALNRRQQIINNENDTENRIVFERIILGGAYTGDFIELNTSESLKINDIDGVYYIYGDDNTIQYKDLNEAIIENIYKPNPGEAVIEWETDGFSYRIFGTSTKDVLLEIVEGLDS